MVPIADGSDTGGSLRNPAAFCNVVGFRPSPGRVPREWASWSPLSVAGPMARSVGDVALFLSAIAGRSEESVVDSRRTAPDSAGHLAATSRARASPGGVDLAGCRSNRRSARWSTANRRVFEDLGCVVEEAEPDFAGVDDAFATLRYTGQSSLYAPLVRERPEWVKDTIKYEVAQAEKLTAADVGRALARQARMYDQSREFFERYDYFVLPVTQVVPFDVTVPQPHADCRHADDVVYRLDAVVLVHHDDGEPGDLGAWRIHRRVACRSAFRLSAAIATTGACCSSPMRSRRRQARAETTA